MEPSALDRYWRIAPHDAPALPELESLLRLAARVLDVDTALVNLLDDDRQWQAAAYGLERGEVPRASAPCAHTVLAGKTIHTADAREDARFRTSPFVTGERAAARMYASSPLLSDGGQVFGTLCVLDERPRHLTEDDLLALEDLARHAAVVFELHLERERSRRSESQQRALAARVAQQVRTDALTGLPTRLVLEERLERAIARSKRNGVGIGLLLVDLDDFDRVSTELGDAAAGDVLRHVARRLSSAIRDIDTVARLAGDQFLVLCEDLAAAAGLDAVARRIDDAMSAPILVAGDIATVNASVGSAYVAGEELSGLSPAELLATADAAMRREGRHSSG